MEEAISLFQTNEELNQIFSHKFIKTIAAIRRVENQAYLKVISSWEREYLLLNSRPRQSNACHTCVYVAV